MTGTASHGLSAPLFASSGNLLADRRYDYAQAEAGAGDDIAAADLLEQALELAPGWAAAWFALGEARGRLGRRETAADAYAQALACDPADPHGAGLRLALAGVAPAPTEMPPAYVRGLFDQYAPRFDAHLTDALAYRGPEVIVTVLRAACAAMNREFLFGNAFDLGCGTGLMARALTPHFQTMHGVDLSAGMIAQAAKTGLYSGLQVGDMLAWLQKQRTASADLVLAADALVYLGDLAPLFAAAALAMTPAGLFVFTAQLYDGEGYALGADMRFAHAPAYLRDCAAAARLHVVLLEEQSTRREAGRDVPGIVCALAREAAG